MEPCFRSRAWLVAGLFVSAVGVGLLVAGGLAAGEGEPAPFPPSAEASPALSRETFPQERRFRNLRQLTFGGQNAEAYWSFDETRLCFQSQRGDLPADQIFTMNRDGSGLRRISTGKGRTTCSYFLPGDKRLLYSSTHLAGDAPPPVPAHDRSLGYVWPVFHSYDIFTVRKDGTDLRRLTDAKGYDAEATVSPLGDRIVFTSSRDGDLELYSMALDGTGVTRLTHRVGYDGGAYYSFDGKRIVWRAPNPADVNPQEAKALLERQLVRPTRLEIWVMNADGTQPRMVTQNGAANFGPFWHPDGCHVIFSSNLHDPKGMNFELYLVNVETLALERVTFFERKRPGARRSDDFDGFPMFTRDGKTLVFCSNRHNEVANDTNVFVVDWVEDLPATEGPPSATGGADPPSR